MRRRRRISAEQGRGHFGFHTLMGAALPEALGATCATAATRARSQQSGDALSCGAQQEACREIEVWKEARRRHARAKRPGGVGPRAPTGPRAFAANPNVS